MSERPEPKVRRELTICGVTLRKYDNGWVWMRTGDDDTWINTWPTWDNRPAMSPALELAQALALFDGSFEVRRIEL